MVFFNLRVVFGFAIMFSTLISFIISKPAAPLEQKQHVEQSKPQSQSNYELLKTFVNKIKHRVSLGKEVAKYKWIEGQPILVEAREKDVLVSVQNMAEGMGLAFKPEDRLFFVDLMEATKLVQYVLVSDWYGTQQKDNTPKESVTLDKVRAEITGMQKELLELLFNLKTMQNSSDCPVFLAKAIGETRDQDILLTLALQRAFGNYCKANISHKP